MGVPESRKVTLLAFCRLDGLSPEEEGLLAVLYDAAVGYMTQAGVREPPEDTPRRAQYDLCVNYLVLDSWDQGEFFLVGAVSSDNPAFRRLLNHLTLTQPFVSNLHTPDPEEGEPS